MNVWLTSHCSFILLHITFLGIVGNNGLDSTIHLKRNKRFLIWTNGGVSKSVLGVSIPVETSDRVNWRSLNLGYNFQAQYVPIPNITFPWTRFGRSLIHQKRLFDEHGTYELDGTRQFAYSAFEMLMNSRGKNGRQCLLRAICEASQTPITQVSVFDEMLQLFLSPNEQEIHTEYIDAKLAGQYGVDCLSLYHKCPHGDSFLDSISYFTS